MHIQKSLADYFFMSRHALHIARQNKEIYALITEYNMTYTEIDAGLTMLENLMNADKKKIELHGKQLEAKKYLQNLFAKVNAIYKSHTGLMKVKYHRNPERLERLMLNVPRERSINGWLRQADTFYANLIKDNDMIDKLDENAISLAVLEASYNQIKQVEQAKNLYRESIGLAQAALEIRDELFAEFDLWMKEFIYICKTALRQQPLLLEALGKIVFSPGYIKHGLSHSLANQIQDRENFDLQIEKQNCKN